MEISLITRDLSGHCNEFYNNFYLKNRSIKEWHWEFEYNSQEQSLLPFVVAIDEGEVIGTQAIIPIKLIDENGQMHMSGKSEETLVAPRCRGKNIFPLMYKLLFQHCDERHIKAIWGFTPATSAFRRVGFDIPGITSQMVIGIRPSFILDNLTAQGQHITSPGKQILYKLVGHLLCAYSSLFRLFKKTTLLPHGISITDNYFDKNDFSKLCRLFVESWGGITVYRDYEYMNWRFFSNPYLKARFLYLYRGQDILGYISYAKDQNGFGFIVDIIIPNSESATTYSNILIDAAIKQLISMGSISIRWWDIGNHPFTVMFAAIGRKRGGVKIKKGNSIVLLNSDLPKKYNNVDNWYITRTFTEGVTG